MKKKFIQHRILDYYDFLLFRLKMTSNHGNAIPEANKGVRVDFQYFIQSAVNQEISWQALVIFLTDLTPSLDKSKEVIKILVEELEGWVRKSKIEANTDKTLPVDVAKKISFGKDDPNQMEDTAIKIESSSEESDNLSDENELNEVVIRQEKLQIDPIVKEFL